MNSSSLDLYTLLYDNVLARLDAELAHQLAVGGLNAIGRVPGALPLLSRLLPHRDPRLVQQLWGLSFENPIGVAAGLDKDALAFDALWSLGFGHVEIGTITPKPQPGNPKPRVWRVADRRALINALGFPSVGGERVRRRLRGRAQRGVLGINLGKNKDTPNVLAAEDYRGLVRLLFDYADYITINVSSPNTPGLRELQAKDELRALIEAVVEQNNQEAKTRSVAPRPLLVKVAPDFDHGRLEQVAVAAVEGGVDGIIATNTTVDRQGLEAGLSELPGGLSGLPLFWRARDAVARLYRTVGQQVPIIGVGGVACSGDVLTMLRAGASLVQLYTGFVYGGPLLPRRLMRELSDDADTQGWANVSELVGYDASREVLSAA
jgi:dihydroorotate dehydrogenase